MIHSSCADIPITPLGKKEPRVYVYGAMKNAEVGTVEWM